MTKIKPNFKAQFHHKLPSPEELIELSEDACIDSMMIEGFCFGKVEGGYQNALYKGALRGCSPVYKSKQDCIDGAIRSAFNFPITEISLRHTERTKALLLVGLSCYHLEDIEAKARWDEVMMILKFGPSSTHE